MHFIFFENKKYFFFMAASDAWVACLHADIGSTQLDGARIRTGCLVVWSGVRIKIERKEKQC